MYFASYTAWKRVSAEKESGNLWRRKEAKYIIVFLRWLVNPGTRDMKNLRQEIINQGNMKNQPCWTVSYTFIYTQSTWLLMYCNYEKPTLLVRVLYIHKVHYESQPGCNVSAIPIS